MSIEDGRVVVFADTVDAAKAAALEQQTELRGQGRPCSGVATHRATARLRPSASFTVKPTSEEG